ncbi:hypothetical protein GE21DRAFT_1210019 [Neurospora crassa]|nr:hypothetical protein GE21DRAFT_1210019 [Neurospora crassa]
MLRILKRRNFAGKNGIYDVRCHWLFGPTILGFWVYVGNGVGARRVTHKLCNVFALKFEIGF